MDNSSVRKQVVGRGVPVRGADIDTDRNYTRALSAHGYF